MVELMATPSHRASLKRLRANISHTSSLKHVYSCGPHESTSNSNLDLSDGSNETSGPVKRPLFIDTWLQWSDANDGVYTRWLFAITYLF